MATTPTMNLHRDMDEDEVMDRVFQSTTKAILVNDKYQTPVNIRFQSDRSGTAINIKEKHAKLLVIMQTIDESVSFIDSQGTSYEDAKTINESEHYEKHFIIDSSQRQEGCIYVQCTLMSKMKINQIKHGKINIMEQLMKEKIFISHRKFTQTTEAKVGYFPGLNPQFHLRSDLRDQINYYLKSMKIHQSELDELPPQNDEDPMVPKTIVFPAYELTPSTVGFGNGSTRIETRAI